MAATLLTAFAGAGGGSESRRSPRASEIWNITGGGGGSADGDTGSIVPRYIKIPQRVIGAVSYTISGQTVTVTSITALADGEVISVEVIGLPR